MIFVNCDRIMFKEMQAWRHAEIHENGSVLKRLPGVIHMAVWQAVFYIIKIGVQHEQETGKHSENLEH